MLPIDKNINITLFGSCRIDGLSKIANTTGLNELNYPHSTKEILQFIDYINGEIEINYPYNIYCFRGALINKLTGGYDLNSITPLIWSENYRNKLEQSNIVVIEISSNRIIELDGYYLHHLLYYDEIYGSTNKELQKSIVRYQEEREIEEDLLKIISKLQNKTIIFVSHFNAIKNSSSLTRREKTINFIKNVCQKYNFNFFNPTEITKKYKQEDILTDDLGHYKELGNKIISESLLNFILEKLNAT